MTEDEFIKIWGKSTLINESISVTTLGNDIFLHYKEPNSKNSVTLHLTYALTASIYEFHIRLCKDWGKLQSHFLEKAIIKDIKGGPCFDPR